MLYNEVSYSVMWGKPVKTDYKMCFKLSLSGREKLSKWTTNNINCCLSTVAAVKYELPAVQEAYHSFFPLSRRKSATILNILAVIILVVHFVFSFFKNNF